MAAESPVESVWEEAPCPVCLEDFTAPLTLECGHNFCQAPLSPQGRDTEQQGPLWPNRQLANVVELAKPLSFQSSKRAKWDGVCGEHQEALKLFCEEDQTPICVVCDKSQAPMVLQIKEAAQEYKEKLETHLKTLREEREKLMRRKTTAEGKSQEYLKWTQAKRQMIVAEFQQLLQFLEEQKQRLLAQLEQLDEAIRRFQIDTVRNLSVQISRISEGIGELEGTCQKPASEFLQDVRSTLSRCEMGQFQLPEEISPELEEQVRGFSQETIALSETLREFKDTLPSALERARGKSLGAFRQGEFAGGNSLSDVRIPLKTSSWDCHWSYQPNPATTVRRAVNHPVISEEPQGCCMGTCGHLEKHRSIAFPVSKTDGISWVEREEELRIPGPPSCEEGEIISNTLTEFPCSSSWRITPVWIIPLFQQVTGH
ncbi:zinc finger protein RFP-like isoform X4 [Pelodiscus sinensis]|uniref:zinc finger protein RFP-like isoform X4 n=1 Tax=Pelodiscus sinensis TaxID=13735 RepID=UPI003F6C65B7